MDFAIELLHDALASGAAIPGDDAPPASPGIGGGRKRRRAVEGGGGSGAAEVAATAAPEARWGFAPADTRGLPPGALSGRVVQALPQPSLIEFLELAFLPQRPLVVRGPPPHPPGPKRAASAL